MSDLYARKCCARAHIPSRKEIGSCCEQAFLKLCDNMVERFIVQWKRRRMMLHQALVAFTYLINAVSSLSTPPMLRLLSAPSITLANATTGAWPPIPVIQSLQQYNSCVTITSRWPLRDSSSSYTEAISKDITRILDSKFPAGQGRDEEPVTDVDAHIAAVKFHLQATEEGTSITLYEAREIVVGVRAMMEKYGPAIVYGRYVRDGVTRASLSFFVEAEVRRAVLKV